MIEYGFYAPDELKQLGLRRYGQNVLIDKSCNIIGYGNISIGNNVRIDALTTIIASGDVSIENYVHIASYVYIGGAGGVAIGSFSGLSHGVKLYSASDDYSGAAMTNPTVPGHLTNVQRDKVTLDRHVIVGSGSVLLPGSVLPEGVAVGALSLVRGELAEWSIYSGSPARRVGARLKAPLDLERQLSL